MDKIHTRDELAGMSLRALSNLHNDHAAAAGVKLLPGDFKCSKEKAVERTWAVLPARKGPRSHGEGKFARLIAALARQRSREELMAASDFDSKNLSVAMSILKRGGTVIRTEVRDGARFYQARA